jgi:hypothetical protein
MPNPDVTSESTISEKMEYIHSTLHDMLTMFGVDDDMVYRSLVFAAQIRATLPHAKLHEEEVKNYGGTK